MTDINGNKPEIYICTSNRTGGKTTYFSRLIVNRFLKHGEKFMLIYRFNYEIDDCADKFFRDIGSLFFNGYHMTSKRKDNGIYHELYINDEPCGYAVSFNSSDKLKLYSHLFSDTSCMFFDEFQSETNHYCDREVEKLISIHISVARGQGKQNRYVPLYMCGNDVSIVNPYFVSLGISSRLKDDTKFLKGDGFVLEHGYIESASKAQTDSAFNRAFASSKHIAYATQNVYLNDNNSFIEKPTGVAKYIATLKCDGKLYALKEYANEGIMYCDDRVDSTYPYKISITTDDHQINYIMLKNNDMLVARCRWLFDMGAFRFKNLACKEVILKMISY